MRLRYRVREVANLVNGSTPIGYLIARIGRAHPVPGPRGLWIATGYRLPFPVAGAFTVGNVITTPHDADWLRARPELLTHEERHTWQYVVVAGPLYFPAYALGLLWSLARTGDPASANPFERAAGLADGGYAERPRRSPAQTATAVRRAVSGALGRRRDAVRRP
ncbi:MAG: hypothetical protein ACR2F6_16520 [Mycobacteriales bacterium]